MSLSERFAAKYVVSSSGCWEWTASKTGAGYGQIWSAAHCRPVVAHRVAYELFVGPIPEGLDIDHLCRNRSCVNPEHMEPVTRRENLLRGETIPARNAAKTHCSRNHEYGSEVKRDRAGRRICRECNRESLRRWRAARNVKATVVA